MSTRPPPLVRAGDRPPTYRMVTRVYSNSLRPIVIVIASIVAIWSLIWAIPSFQDINEDKENGQPKFAIFDIVLGAIYATACAIEVFGLVAAATQRLPLVRVYAMLSIVASVIIIGAGFLRVVVHFAYKDGLITECKNVVQGEGIEFRFGIWGHRVKEKLNAADAATFCNNAWNRDSLDEILYLIFEIIFLNFITVIAYAYYHQVMDPTSVANVTRAPAPPFDGPHPEHYNRPYAAEPGYAPYNSGAPNPYQQQQSYAPPPGPPPSNMGYGVGMGVGADDMKDKQGSDLKDYDDPFADFDGPTKSSPSPSHPPPSGMPPAH